MFVSATSTDVFVKSVSEIQSLMGGIPGMYNIVQCLTVFCNVQNGLHIDNVTRSYNYIFLNTYFRVVLILESDFSLGHPGILFLLMNKK